MSIVTKPFGTMPDGRPVTEYILQNESGASVGILDLGGTLTRLLVPDREGNLGDVNLSVTDLGLYLRGECGSMGAIIGRYGNRIAGAQFTLEGREYVLDKNNGENNLHGGLIGFNKLLWKAEPSEKDGVCALKLTLTSPDGDQGFPGTLDLTVTYTFDQQNALGICYEARTDKTTLCNLTNHAYFNLDGHQTGSIMDQELQVFADFVTEVGPGLIPTGKLLGVQGTAFDFTKPTRFGDVLSRKDSEPALRAADGVDCNYCMGRDRETKVAAIAYSPKTGREMVVETDQPGVQVYTAQHLSCQGKDGVAYGAFQGFCLETQHYPDSPHQPHFPSTVLRPEDTYYTKTVYRFGVRKA